MNVSGYIYQLLKFSWANSKCTTPHYHPSRIVGSWFYVVVTKELKPNVIYIFSFISTLKLCFSLVHGSVCPFSSPFCVLDRFSVWHGETRVWGTKWTNGVTESGSRGPSDAQETGK